MSQPYQYKCPYCGSPERPLYYYKTSTGGWIVFAVLLLVCFPFCFLGLLMKEGYQICGNRPLDIQSLYSNMLAPKLKEDAEPEEGMTYGLGVGPRTVRYTHSVLSSALKQAVRWSLLYRNPCDLVTLPKQVRREMYALSSEEAGRFLTAVKEDRYSALFGLALVTGMRPEEYLALKWSDVDLTKGTVTVRRALVWRKGGGWYFTEPKTSRSRRTIPIPQSMVKALSRHKKTQGVERLKLGADWQHNDLVFTAEYGTPFNIRNLTLRHFKPA